MSTQPRRLPQQTIATYNIACSPTYQASSEYQTSALLLIIHYTTTLQMMDVWIKTITYKPFSLIKYISRRSFVLVFLPGTASTYVYV